MFEITMRTSTRYFALLAFCLLSIVVLYIINDNIIESKKKFTERLKSLHNRGVQKPHTSIRDDSGAQGHVHINNKHDSKLAEKDLGKPIIYDIGSTTECMPKHNITFTKVHKTGSSTVQNILLRYGDRHNLKFVLPPRGHHLGYPSYFDKSKHMLHTSDEVYNIFCHHARFSLDAINIMPPSTVYISVLRNPVDVFESAFSYFKMDYRMGAADDPQALTIFLNDPRNYVAKMKSAVHTRNNMLFDFGVPIEDFDDEQKIKHEIGIMSQRFSLILIAEYFEESLILLRDLLCWRTEDMVVFKLNSRNENSVQNLTPTSRQKIIDWNNGDMLLYHHFNQTLWKQIDSYGRKKMAKEVKKLNKMTNQYYRDCVESDQAQSRDAEFKVWQPKGVQINGFILKEQAKGNLVCERMVKPEIQYTEDLRQKQFGVNHHGNQRLGRWNNPKSRKW